MGAIADIVEQIRDEIDATTRRAGRLQAALDALLAEEGAPATVPAPEPATATRAKATKAAKPKRPASPDPLPADTWPEVARIANEAIAKGESAARAVAAHFGITADAARMRIRRARQLGHFVTFVRADRAAPSAQPPRPPRHSPDIVTVDEAAALLESLPA